MRYLSDDDLKANRPAEALKAHGFAPRGPADRYGYVAKAPAR
jgi:hypothetical protein